MHTQLLLLLVALALNNNQPGVTTCTVRFEATNAGFVVEGSLKAEVVTWNFDPTRLSNSYVIIVGRPSSIDTGIPIRDKHLQRADFFDSHAYPEIKLASKSFRKIDGNRFQGIFDLSTKGISKEIEVPFQLRNQGSQTYYEGAFSIDRLAFGIGEQSVTLSNHVVIRFKLY